MKATDLMIGNWVRVYIEDNDPTQCGYVTCKVEYLHVLGDIGAGGHDYREEDVKPIELTTAILKENGFACIEIGDNGPSTPRQNVNRYEKWQVRTQWHTIDIFYDRLKKKWRFNGKYIEFVHELQQEYKRCKIEEEVKL